MGFSIAVCHSSPTPLPILYLLKWSSFNNYFKLVPIAIIFELDI